jgi:uncharacterized protein YndB with AHSA1/START domain
MATAMDHTPTRQVYRIFIQATPEAIWDAITKPDWNERYGYRCRQEFDLRPGGAYKAFANDDMRAMGTGEVAVDGEVIEADPPHRLVQTWRATWTGEPATRLTYEIAAGLGGVSSLTLIHELDGAPGTAAQVGGAIEGAGGGWSEVLSDLKTLLETGKPLYV